MSANLLIAVVAAGIVAAGLLHWFAKGRGRAQLRQLRQHKKRKRERSGNSIADKNEPALSALDELGGQGEIPLLDVPVSVAGADELSPGFAAAAQALAESSAAQTAHAAAGDGGDSGAIDDDSTTAGHSPQQPAQPGHFRRRPADGFERLSQIDFWAKITGARDVGRETVLALYHDGAAGLSKPHGIHGVKAADKTWRNLEDEAEDSRFADLVVTLQLADRNGAVGAEEMTRFSNLVSKLSEGTGREFQFMTTTDNALAQAAAVAEFVEHFDSVFVVNISPAPAAGADGGRAHEFNGAAIDRYAPRMGLERDGNAYYSRFKQVGKGRARLYSLADRSDTGKFDFRDMQSFASRGLIFFTKPAVNRSPGAVFAEMVDTAKAFAARMQGVVDSPGRGDLSQDDVEEIRRSIEQVAADMERAGIAAGSDEAARLFA